MIAQRGGNYVYKFAPDYEDNRFRPADEVFYFVFRCLNNADEIYKQEYIVDASRGMNNTEAHRTINLKTHELVKTKLIEIVNYFIEGVGKIETIEQLFEHGHTKVFSELCEAVANPEKAWAGDIRNLGLKPAAGFGPTTYKGPRSIFEFRPATPENLALPIDKQICFELDCFTNAEEEQLQVYATECEEKLPTAASARVWGKKRLDMVKGHIKNIRNLTLIDSVEQNGDYVDVEIPIRTGEEYFANASGGAIETFAKLVRDPGLLSRLEAKK